MSLSIKGPETVNLLPSEFFRLLKEVILEAFDDCFSPGKQNDYQ